MKIVFASSNQGKVKELQKFLQEYAIEITPEKVDVEETGLTFVENALLKARYASEKSGLPAIADDSGLEVMALQGRPGIYSARYAGMLATDTQNTDKLLQELKDYPEDKRKARFYCALVYLTHALDPTPLICCGSWEGTILKAPQGKNGFGYDPVFYVPSEHCSAAELSSAKKNELSHRGKALRQLVEKLPDKR